MLQIFGLRCPAPCPNLLRRVFFEIDSCNLLKFCWFRRLYTSRCIPRKAVLYKAGAIFWSEEREFLRRLFVTCCVFTRYFFVVFSSLFRGPLLSRKTVFEPFSLLFRGFFVAPALGKFYAYSPWNSLLAQTLHDSQNCDRVGELQNAKNLLMDLFLMGCFPGDFQEVERPINIRHSGKGPIKVAKRPIKEGKG